MKRLIKSKRRMKKTLKKKIGIELLMVTEFLKKEM